MIHACCNCLHLIDFEVCEYCGECDALMVIEFRPAKHKNHYQVFVDNIYVGTIYKAYAKYEGEPYPVLNKEACERGILEIEERIPIHKSKIRFWTFRNNLEEPFTNYRGATIALFESKGIL